MHKKSAVFTLLTFLVACTSLLGQLPKTEVYVAEFKNLFSKPQVLSLKYLNSYNKKGYNNQPRFISYDEIMLTSAIDTHQITDIYQLNLRTEEIFRVTATDQISEFSPAPAPGSGHFTCVRIEADGKDQSLWQYPNDRSSTGKRLLPNLKNVGYYTWLGKDTVAVFLVGSTNTLAIANTMTQKVDVVLDDIGRCLKNGPDGNLYLVHKTRPDAWILKSYHIKDKAMTTITQMPQGCEDFEILSNGAFVTGSGSVLRIFNPEKEKQWITLADFKEKGITGISRITASRDRIAFVNTKK